MNNSNARKRELLGMTFGRANGILRKSLLFSMAHKLGMGKCYVCTKIIKELDEFSIEHKKPWGTAKDPKEAFFDLDNVAFSHINCNVRDYANKRRKPKEHHQKRKREEWAKHYEKNSEQILERKRARYHANK